MKNPVVIFALNSLIDVLEENVLRTELDRDFVRYTITSHEMILEKIKARERGEAHHEIRKHIEMVHEKLESIHKSQ